jgi:CO/xanthine dehydrogenase Mo-binding subunit
MVFLPFLEDIYPDDLLYAVTIRSPIAKGKFKFIQSPKLPDSYTLITAKDIPGENRLESTNIPILADKNLSYIGEPVGILLGNNKTRLEELASGCKVIADEETAVFSCDDDNCKTAAVCGIKTGNSQSIFEKHEKTVTGYYSTGIQEHWYAEPVGAVVWYNDNTEEKSKEPEKLLTVKTATQWPYHVKRSVIRALGIDPALLSIEPTELNLHMDGKLWYPSLIACHAALGAYITKKPVRLILNREEDFLYTPKRCKADIKIISAIDDNGNITASEIDICVNLGAYGVNSNEILDQTCLGSFGNYRIPCLKLNAKAVKSNIPPQGPFSGFGLSQGFFAIESHISYTADLFKQNPVIYRQNNFSKDKNQVLINELIDTSTKSSDFYRKWASYELLRQYGNEKKPEKGENPRGIGMSLGYQGNELLYDNNIYSVEATLTKEGILEIKTSIVSSEDYVRIWEKIVIQTMSIEPDKIRVIVDNSPDCGPSCASRNITLVTRLVEKCCQAIKKQRANTPLPITVRRSSKPQNGTFLNGSFSAPAGKTMNINTFSKPGQVCAVVEVSIDVVECIPKIRGVWLGVSGGKIISLNRAKRSLTRGVIQALGWAYTEYIEYKDGIIPQYQYDNFSIPSPADIPPIHIDFLFDDSKEIKGIGELPFTCIPAAFLQAVSQAMDFNFKSIPLGRKEIWEMIRQKFIDIPAGVK